MEFGYYGNIPPYFHAPTEWSLKHCKYGFKYSKWTTWMEQMPNLDRPRRSRLNKFWQEDRETFPLIEDGGVNETAWEQNACLILSSNKRDASLALKSAFLDNRNTQCSRLLLFLKSFEFPAKLPGFLAGADQSFWNIPRRPQATMRYSSPKHWESSTEHRVDGPELWSLAESSSQDEAGWGSWLCYLAISSTSTNNIAG